MGVAAPHPAFPAKIVQLTCALPARACPPIKICNSISMSESQLPRYTWEEISRHNNASSLWIVLDGKVYDVTSWKDEVGILPR